MKNDNILEPVIFRLPPKTKKELKALLAQMGTSIQDKFSNYSFSLLEKNKENFI